jgi:hypothetical protein
MTLVVVKVLLCGDNALNLIRSAARFGKRRNDSSTSDSGKNMNNAKIMLMIILLKVRDDLMANTAAILTYIPCITIDEDDSYNYLYPVQTACLLQNANLS